MFIKSHKNLNNKNILTNTKSLQNKNYTPKLGYKKSIKN